MRKLFKLISIILIIALTFMASMTFAKPIVTDSDKVTTNANNIETIVGEAKLSAINDTEKTVESTILGTMQWIGYAIAVGMLIYIGIKYVTAAADERASLKGSLVKYVIGAILIAGAVTVVDIAFSMGNQPEQNQNTPASSGGISFNQTM